MEPRPAILLIHGACHGSWCWKYLLPLLEARGWDVNTIDLPGRNPSPVWGWRLRLRDQAEAIAAKSAAIGRPVVALAHSMGGISMSAAAELEPTLFQRLVYLSAYLPASGERLATLGARDRSSRVSEATRTAILKGFISINAETAKSIFYGDCSTDRIDWAIRLLCKEPLRPAFDSVFLSERFAAVPRSYIRCSEDQVVTPELQVRRGVSSRLKASASLSNTPSASGPDLAEIPPIDSHCNIGTRRSRGHDREHASSPGRAAFERFHRGRPQNARHARLRGRPPTRDSATSGCGANQSHAIRPHPWTVT